MRRTQLRPLTPPDGGSTLPRPDRFPRLVAAPADARARIAGKRVLVVGAGGVGGRLVDGLARLGVGGLDVVDPGLLAPENLATHSIGTGELGLSKARAAGLRAVDVAPEARVRVARGVAEALPLEAWFQVDLILLASDHPAVEVEVGQRALWAQVPLIHAALHGDTLVSQVRVFGADPSGPCPACAFGAHEWELVGGARRFNCDGGGQPQAPDSPPTVAPAFLCGLAADLALSEALALLLGLRPAADRLVEHCGYTQRTVVAPLTRRAECRCEHLGLSDLGSFDPAETTAQDLAAQAGLPLERVTVEVEDVPFAREGACEAPSCPIRGRFAPGSRARAACAGCGGDARPHAFHQRVQVPLDELPTRPLAELGLTGGATMILRADEAGALARLHDYPEKSEECQA